MGWLLSFFRKFFGMRDSKLSRPQLIGMYFNDNNRGARRKTNRERA